MKKVQSKQLFTEKERAVINLVAAGINDVVKACRMVGYDNPAEKAQELLSRDDFYFAIEKSADPEADVVVKSQTARKRFWARIMNDPEISPKDKIRASELLAKASGDFVDQINVNFSPANLLSALEKQFENADPPEEG